jgi:hypothetical protein
MKVRAIQIVSTAIGLLLLMAIGLGQDQPVIRNDAYYILRADNAVSELPTVNGGKGWTRHQSEGCR